MTRFLVGCAICVVMAFRAISVRAFAGSLGFVQEFAQTERIVVFLIASMTFELHRCSASAAVCTTPVCSSELFVRYEA